MKPLYCITHETWVTLPWDVFDNCITTSCHPPELPVGWENDVVPPTDEELILIDQNAKELALELVL